MEGLLAGGRSAGLRIKCPFADRHVVRLSWTCEGRVCEFLAGIVSMVTVTRRNDLYNSGLMLRLILNRFCSVAAMALLFLGAAAASSGSSWDGILTDSSGQDRTGRDRETAFCRRQKGTIRQRRRPTELSLLRPSRREHMSCR